MINHTKRHLIFFVWGIIVSVASFCWYCVYSDFLVLAIAFIIFIVGLYDFKKAVDSEIEENNKLFKRLESWRWKKEYTEGDYDWCK